MLAAKFSASYAVAPVVVSARWSAHDRCLGVQRCGAGRPASAPLAARVEVSGDDTGWLRGGPDPPPARVSAHLRDCRWLTRETAIVHGNTANSRPRHELEAKFRALASEAPDPGRALLGTARRTVREPILPRADRLFGSAVQDLSSQR